MSEEKLQDDLQAIRLLAEHVAKLGTEPRRRSGYRYCDLERAITNLISAGHIALHRIKELDFPPLPENRH